MKARSLPLLAASLVVVFLGFSAWYYQNHTLQDTDTAFFLQRFSDRLAIMCAWVAAWSWIGFVARGDAKVSQHISVTALAGLIDVCLLNMAMSWLFFAMGWPWPNSFHELTRYVLVVAIALGQLRMAWGTLTNRLVLFWAMAGCATLTYVCAINWAEQNGTESLKTLPYQVNIYPANWTAPAEPSLDRGLDQLWEKAGWHNSMQKAPTSNSPER